MTDVELTRLLSDLEDSATKLNAASDSVNDILKSVESRLVAMNLGLETWSSRPIASEDEIKVFQGGDGEERTYTVTHDTELGFAKAFGEWCLAIRTELGEPDPHSSDLAWAHESGPERLADASRQLRIDALRHLPELLKTVNEKARTALAAIDEAKKLMK
jgi:hypothetical protein